MWACHKTGPTWNPTFHACSLPTVPLEPAGLSGSAVEPPVRAVQPRFDLNPVQMTRPDRNGDRSTVGPVGPAGPVRFLKHCL